MQQGLNLRNTWGEENEAFLAERTKEAKVLDRGVCLVNLRKTEESGGLE